MERRGLKRSEIRRDVDAARVSKRRKDSGSVESTKENRSEAESPGCRIAISKYVIASYDQDDDSASDKESETFGLCGFGRVRLHPRLDFPSTSDSDSSAASPCQGVEGEAAEGKGKSTNDESTGSGSGNKNGDCNPAIAAQDGGADDESRGSGSDPGSSDKSSEWTVADCVEKKELFSRYKVVQVEADGRCLFRSVAVASCVNVILSYSEETYIADALRWAAMDEMEKRQEEWRPIIETVEQQNFEEYVRDMRSVMRWGGEYEMLMLSHVLHTPIACHVALKPGTVAPSVVIAVYGEEYQSSVPPGAAPIRVLYDGAQHYGALIVPGEKTGKKMRFWRAFLS